MGSLAVGAACHERASSSRSRWPTASSSYITHDFFQDQPVRDVDDVYEFRWIWHD
ncbi:hypothetical protein F4778DRAFT_759828 [Xylariomycetidae sp. FL2044]|nr:hypothetical protein F4778DRAFT_759828 [Xylariomycetidae sp. FL2044]